MLLRDLRDYYWARLNFDPADGIDLLHVYRGCFGSSRVERTKDTCSSGAREHYEELSQLDEKASS